MPWLPLSRAGSTPRRQALWLCRCDACGSERVIEGWTARHRPPACRGCLARSRAIRPEAADLIGRFYKLALRRAWAWFKRVRRRPDEADVIDVAHDALMAAGRKWDGGDPGGFPGLVARAVRWQAMTKGRKRRA